VNFSFRRVNVLKRHKPSAEALIAVPCEVHDRNYLSVPQAKS
jgi:hypothetical protein